MNPEACAPARQVVWAPVREARKSLNGPGASGGAAPAESGGVGSIFVVMAGLVKSSFSTTGGGSQARAPAQSLNVHIQNDVPLASQAAVQSCIMSVLAVCTSLGDACPKSPVGDARPSSGVCPASSSG